MRATSIAQSSGMTRDGESCCLVDRTVGRMLAFPSMCVFCLETWEAFTLEPDAGT
jgi:hypothetical protein